MKKKIILFQGDSVTDAGRSRNDVSSLGNGYAMMAASWHTALNPEKDFEFINKGIGGNRTIDLVKRWEEDCICIKPDIVSILIGINDCWRRYDSKDPTSAGVFEENYRIIIEMVRERLDSKIILCEPFLLHVLPGQKEWREDLDPKIEVVRKLSAEYGTLLLPLDRIFQRVSKIRPPGFWANDGVHPSQYGHALIAAEWLKLSGI
jgi:acyl-CoA thioesterase I